MQYVSNADERALEDQEPVEVLVVETAIAQGTAVADIGDAVSVKLIPGAVRAPSALASLDSVQGLVAAVDLLPGEQVMASRFVSQETLLADALTVEAPEGTLELTVSLTAERSVGGTLVPGDLVAVLSSFEPFVLDAVEPENEEDLNQFLNSEENAEPITLSTPNSTGITVHKALVTRVQVTEAPPEGTTNQSTGVDVARADTVLVTLAVQPGDAEQIVFTAEFGAIWLARESESTPEEDPVLIITRANVYR